MPKTHAAEPSTAKKIEGNTDLYSRLITTTELGEAISLCDRSIHYLKKRRAIPYIKIGRSTRFRLRDVERALEKLTIREVTLS